MSDHDSDSTPAVSEAPRPAAPGRARRLLRSLREAIAGTQEDFTQGSLNRAVYLLAVPMVLEMGMESVFAICDAFFVARLGADALATVGLTEAMLTLLYAVAVGVAMATTAQVARRIGEKRPEEAARSAVQAIGLATVVAVAVGVPGFVFREELLGLMGASASVVETGATYTGILYSTNLVILLLFVNNAIFRGAGDASIAMQALALANGINLILDPCLIFGLGPFPEMGLTGAAVATTIGRGSGVVFQLVRMTGSRGRLRVRREHMQLAPRIMKRLLRLAANSTGQFLVSTASWVALVRIVSGFGGTAVAGYTLAIRIVIFALLPAFGISNAAATLVGQNLGAKKPDRAEAAVWLTGFYTTAFLAVVTVIFVFLGRPIVEIFTRDPALVPVAADCLRIISYGYVFYAWGMVIVQAFNGAGDTGTPLRINLVCFWMLQIPLAWLLARHTSLGANGVFWAIAISEAILTVVATLVFRRGGWKTREV